MTSATPSGTGIRGAHAGDARRCAEIYAPYVRNTAVSFELHPPTAAQMGRRIEQASERHAWVVLEETGRIVGYAYGGPFMARAAYRWSCSVSVYLEQGRRRTGAGRALYSALFDRLTARGLQMALAGIALPNDASVGLHRAVGFEPVGVYRRVGWKLGRWHDVQWWQRPLGAGQAPPPELR